jgi:hypothetical protein
VDRFRGCARRELIFCALGTMDVCVITPLFAPMLSRVVPAQRWPVAAIFFAAILGVHYLARLALWLPLSPGLRPVLLGGGMLASGLLALHEVLHAQTPLFRASWLVDIFRSLQASSLSHESASHDVILFLLVLFLWWRGLVLAQRRIDGQSVAFRFRFGLVMLAITTAMGGFIMPGPVHHFVFLYFFASLLGVALARAEEVGQQYGGSQSPFGLAWLGTLVAVTLVVLGLSAGVAALLTGENLTLIVRPVLLVLQIVLFGLVYVAGLAAQVLVTALQFLVGEIHLEGFRRQLSQFIPESFEPRPALAAAFTTEQLVLLRTGGAIAGVLVLVVVIALSLRGLRALAGRRRRDERESVWEGTHVRRGLRDLLRRGRDRLDAAAAALSRSALGRFFAARTIRRIYALLGALAAERGYPRPEHQTPYEYLPLLERAFAENRADLACITEAYVAVHYGEVPERPEDLAAVQAAWEGIRGGEG